MSREKWQETGGFQENRDANLGRFFKDNTNTQRRTSFARPLEFL
jgi:hypothetical protein